MAATSAIADNVSRETFRTASLHPMLKGTIRRPKRQHLRLRPMDGLAPTASNGAVNFIGRDRKVARGTLSASAIVSRETFWRGGRTRVIRDGYHVHPLPDPQRPTMFHVKHSGPAHPCPMFHVKHPGGRFVGVISVTVSCVLDPGPYRGCVSLARAKPSGHSGHDVRFGRCFT